MRKIWLFISDAGGWTVASNAASLVFYVLGLIAVSKYGTTITVFVMVAISAPLCWAGAYFAWKKQHDARLAAEARLYSGRPVLSLEVVREDESYWQHLGEIFFLQNVGDRAARDVQLKPVSTQSGQWRIVMDHVGTLVPKEKAPLSFSIECDGQAMPKGGAVHYLRYFLRDGLDLGDSLGHPPPGKQSFQVSATFYDLNDKRWEDEWVLECDMPSMRMTVRPTVRQLG
jgi:hypothetical protein